MIKHSSITISSEDSQFLMNPTTITVSIVDGKFVDSVCSDDLPILIDYPMDDADKKDLRDELIELVSGDSRVNIWRGSGDGCNLYFAIQDGHIVHLNLLTDVIESLNKHNEMLRIYYDDDIE